MSNALLLLQQQVGSPAKLAQPIANPWQFWTVETLASVTQCPAQGIADAWPAIYAALDARGIATQAICAGVIGTIAIETASTFKPVKEAFWLDDAWRQANLRYYPWYGRGYIQLTWQTNYSNYGKALDVDLLTDPEVAMQPDVAARIIAEFFVQSKAAEAAAQQNWPETRRRVQGGHDGLDRLVRIVTGLGQPG